MQWGINKTMAQIHALLLISPEAMNTDRIMEELEISRGNAHMNLRALMEWGLISKTPKCGERCDYFHAEKDLNIVFKNILEHRRKRELDPILHELDDLLKCNCVSDEAKEFKSMLKNISGFAHKTDQALTVLVKTDSHWFYNTLFQILK